MPADIVEVSWPIDVVATTVPAPEGKALVVRVDRLLAKITLAESAAEAARKRNEGAVHIDEKRVETPTYLLLPGKHVIRVGK